MSQMAEPAWVADEKAWAKAKSAAAKQDPDNVYALATYIYKKMGGKIKGKTKAADSSTGFPQALRPETKESIGFITTRFSESEPAPAKSGDPVTQATQGSRFHVCLIEEGMGNLSDAHYYSKEALRGAVRTFEAKKIYADHPSSLDEQVRPERSVRDILGWFENVRAREGVGGRVSLVGDVVLVGGDSFAWARDLMKEAVAYAKRYSDKQFIGLSINATGAAEPVDLNDFLKDPSIPEDARVKLFRAAAEGITHIRKVTAITEAVSCDLVTEAGAGGKVLSLIEQEKKRMGDGQHADAEQDRKLIDEMLAQYMAGEDHDDSDRDMAGECMNMAKEMGYEGADAMQAASTHMKMMKYKAKKTAEATAAEEAKKAEEAAKHPAESDKKKTEEQTQEAEMEKIKELEAKLAETNTKLGETEKQLLEANGKIAALEESNRKTEVAAHLESKLAESKLPNAITKKFRESIGDKCKTKAEIDERWDLFKEAYEASKAELKQNDFVFNKEKFTTDISEGEGGGKGGFTPADCIR